MKDSFGTEIEIGQIVEIKNAYFKTDNARYVVDNIWNDKQICLYKLNKNNTKSKSKYNICHWPIECYVSDWSKTCEANAHNKTHATIEVQGVWKEPEAKPIKNDVVFTSKGIKKGEDYCSCFYELEIVDGQKVICINARHYDQHIPREIGNVRNDSDCMTDYFETDRCRIFPDSKYYANAFEACKKQQCGYHEKQIKKLEENLNHTCGSERIKNTLNDMIAGHKAQINKFYDPELKFV